MANPELLPFPPLTPKPGWPQCPAFPPRAQQVWPGCRGMGYGLVQHATAVSLAKAQLCQGPAGKTFLLHSSEESSGQPCPPASSLRPEADENQNAAYPRGPATTGPEPHIAAPAPQASSLLWAGPSSQRQGWLGPLSHVGQPRACQLGLVSQWLLSPGRGAGPSGARRVMSQAPGTRSGKLEAQEEVAKTGRVRSAQQPTAPHTHSTHTISCQGDYCTTGRSDSLGPRGWRG